MNKINILFLSGLVLIGSSAHGMWDAVNRGLNNARNEMQQDVQNAPVFGVAAQARQTRQQMRTAKQNINSFKKDADGIVNEVFEVAEAVASAGFGFKQYNSYLSMLDTLQEAVAFNQDHSEDPIVLAFEADDFKDLVDAEKAALNKQKVTRPVVNRSNRKQPVATQPKVGVVTGLVTTLERNIEAYNRVIDAQGRAANLQQRGQGRNIGVANNSRNTLVQAKKALDATIDSLRTTLEKQRDAECTKSPVGKFVYGGSGLRSWLTMGALALGALYFGKAMKDEPVVQDNIAWVRESLAGAFDWLVSKFA